MSVQYPTDDDLERIHAWNFLDVRGLFDFIENDEGMQCYGSFKRTILPDASDCRVFAGL